MRSGRAVLMLAMLVVALPVLAKDKHKDRQGGWNSRSPEWGAGRTDREWRRYTDGGFDRRYTDRNSRWYSGRPDRFRGLDVNGDGVITRGEWRGNYKSFSRQDRDGDGMITARDHRYSRLRYATDEAWRRNDRLRMLDTNGDGVISQEELSRRR